MLTNFRCQYVMCHLPAWNSLKINTQIISVCKWVWRRINSTFYNWSVYIFLFLLFLDEFLDYKCSRENVYFVKSIPISPSRKWIRRGWRWCFMHSKIPKLKFNKSNMSNAHQTVIKKFLVFLDIFAMGWI